MKEEFNNYTAQQRTEVANHYYQDGQALIKQSQQQNFEDNETLQNACSAFITSIKINPEDPRPFLSLANIFLHLEDFTTAHHYIDSALKLNTLNILALDLKKKIQSKAFIKTILNKNKLQLAQTTPHNNEDLNDLYEQSETWIKHKVKDIMENNFPTLAAHSLKLNEYKSQLSYLKDEYKEFQHTLTILDEELDINELYIIARPFEVFIERFQTLIFHNQQYLTLNDEIFSEARWLKQCIIKVKRVNTPGELTQLEGELDLIKDKHNLYHNQIEEFKRLKLPIHHLQTKWLMLNQILEHYEDVLEDAFMSFI